MKTALITGITGQDGAYLSKLLLKNDYQVIGLVRSLDDFKFKKLKHLGIIDDISYEIVDLTNFNEILSKIKRINPDEIYNLAAQSSVGLSFKDPYGSMNFNIVSTLNILESIRCFNKNIRFYQASSSEMYGKNTKMPITESSELNPISPYGVSKASAHMITKSYRENFGLHASCGILFNHESYLRDESFFVKKVITQALEIKRGCRTELVLGNLSVKRDFGSSKDYVKAIWGILQQEKADDYVICSGKSIFLSEIVNYVFKILDIPKEHVKIDNALYRPLEIPDIYGDCSKAKSKLGWEYEKNFFQVLDELILEELETWENSKS